MKNKISFLLCGFFLFVSLTFTSCLSTLSEVVRKPQIKFDSITLKSMDMEGWTFDVGYSIMNPYPVSFSVAGINCNIINSSDNSTITTMDLDEGVTVLGMDSTKNRVDFKIPYKTILALAAKLVSNNDEPIESIPLCFKGSAKLDLSSVPLFEGETLSLPFSKNFDVPVFKPSFSISSPTLQMPTLNDLKNALVDGGLGVIKAATLAANIIAGNKLSADALDGVNLDMKFRFNLNVKNEGSCSWNYLLNDCSLTSGSNYLAKVTPEQGNSISSKEGTIPVYCTLNTIQSGRYIVELLNKTAKNPVVSIDSILNFPGVNQFLSNIPLDYSKEISISSISKK